MTITTTIGSALVGLERRDVRVTAKVEPCDTSRANLIIHGLPEVTAREARIRVRSALGYDVHSAEVTVEGLPDGADTAQLDLPIAVAIMHAMGARVGVPPDAVLVGELALDGRVRPVRGALCHVDPDRPTVVSYGNVWEAALSAGKVYEVSRLADVCEPLLHVGRSEFAPHTPHGAADAPAPIQELLAMCRDKCRVLLVGPPGSGKTLFASTVSTSAQLLKPIERREVAEIYGVAGLIGDRPLTAQRPFRAPYHTVSVRGLVGGGERPRPGEVSLAHRGILFLDEVIEFRSTALLALAEALRDGEVRFAKRGAPVRFPAQPHAVIAAANPCPCGYRGHPTRECRCSERSLRFYEERLSRTSDMLGLERVEVEALAGAAVFRRSSNDKSGHLP